MKVYFTLQFSDLRLVAEVQVLFNSRCDSTVQQQELYFIMKCYYVNDKSTGFTDCLIPGCLEGWYNDKWCTCYKFINPIKPKGRKKIENEIEELEKECSWLKSRMKKVEEDNHKLKLENDTLEHQGLPIALRRKLDKDPMLLYKFIMKAMKAKQIDWQCKWWEV